MGTLDQKISELSKDAEITLDVEAANDRWQQELDGVRKQYMDWQTRESKNAWQKEQKVMYDAIYETWQEDGNACKKKLLASETAWEGWRDQSGFTKLETADMAKAKEAGIHGSR